MVLQFGVAKHVSAFRLGRRLIRDAIHARRICTAPVREGYSFGVQATGIDFARMSDTSKAQLASLVASRGVVVLRDQEGLRIGDQMAALGPRTAMTSHTGLLAGMQQHNVAPQMEGDALDVEPGFQWHADGVHLTAPPLMMLSTSLHCLDVTEEGASTQFVSGRSLYNALPSDLRVDAERALVRYCAWKMLPNANKRMRHDGLRLAEDVPPPAAEEAICSEHPLVRWVSGQDGFKHSGLYAVPAFVHSVRLACGEVMDTEASRNWLASVLEVAGLASVSSEHGHSYVHEWKKGDVVFWDNRWVLHRTMPPAKWIGVRCHHHNLTSGPSHSEGPASEAELQEALTDVSARLM